MGIPSVAKYLSEKSRLDPFGLFCVQIDQAATQAAGK